MLRDAADTPDDPVHPTDYPDAGEADALWRLLVAIADARRRGSASGDGGGIGGGIGDAAGHAVGHAVGDDSRRSIERAAGGHWALSGPWSEAAHRMLALYRPLVDLPAGRRFVIAHLGQSIDGRIATSTGDSCYVNGPRNLAHLHRLRALCDAVLVGAGTVTADDPQLTTRLVEGPDATRVVLDPSARVGPTHRVCSDPRAPTLLARFAAAPAERCGLARILPVDAAADGAHAGIDPAAGAHAGIDLDALLGALAGRGLRVVLVEGGGVTVSRFLQAGLLDRLQIAVAPLIIGSGRPGLQLPDVGRLGDCLRPACDLHRMGADVLWDFNLRPAAPAGPRDRPSASSGLRRSARSAG